MLFNIWTEPIRPKTFPKVKFTAGGVEIDETIQALGSFNRPYLCVVPALILIAILTMLNLVWKFSISSNNIFENVYNYVVGTLVENTATTGNRNPFYSNDGEETNRNTGNVEGSFREQEPKALAVTNDRIMKPQEIYVST